MRASFWTSATPNARALRSKRFLLVGGEDRIAREEPVNVKSLYVSKSIGEAENLQT